MPGTYRYSATFDKPYVEEAAPPRSPVRFSIGSWQGASNGGSVGVPAATASAPTTNGPGVIENPPLNCSYRNNARTASTDSLDSGSCGSSSGSSAGHSRQVSIDGMDSCIPTRAVALKHTVQTHAHAHAPVSAPTLLGPAAVAGSNNPMKFVKVGPVPLYKKVKDAEEQIKLAKETKICREKVKENEEAWQSNLDSWKNRRRKVSEKTIQRLEEMKMIEEEEQMRIKPTKIKTFTEMMEERAHKPRSYNLSIYVDNSDEDKLNSSTDLNLQDQSSTESRSNRNSVFSNDDEDCDDNELLKQIKSEDLIEKQIDDTFNRITLEVKSDKIIHHKTTASIDDGFAEEDCNVFGLYTGDSGLESFGSSQRVGDLQDSCSELSTDSGSVYDRVGLDDEHRPITPIGQLTTGTDLLEEFSSKKNGKTWPENLQEKEGHVQLSLRMWMKPEIKEKDFGFTLKVAKSDPPTVTVDFVKSKSVGAEAGLLVGDEVLAVNGETAIGRSHSSLMFSVKQSLYRGHLDLIVSRSETDDVINNIESDDEELPVKHRGPSQRRLMNGRSVDDLSQKGIKESNFRTRSRSESSRSRDDWSQNLAQPEPPASNYPVKEAKKIPPPIPAKPKFKTTSGGGPLAASSSMENLLSPVLAVPLLVELEDDNNVSSGREDDFSRFEPVEIDRSEVNVMDDTIESESDSIGPSMTPLVRTLSNGFRDAAESPSFLKRDADDVCLSDYNESELEVEKELEAEMVVKKLQESEESGGGALVVSGNAENNQDEWMENCRPKTVNVHSLERLDSSGGEGIEESIFKVSVPEVNSIPLSAGAYCEIQSPNDGSQTHYSMSNHPLYQENGLNIIFQSHPQGYAKDDDPVTLVETDSRPSRGVRSQLEGIKDRVSDAEVLAPDAQREQPQGGIQSRPADLFLANSPLPTESAESDKLFEDSDNYHSDSNNDQVNSDPYAMSVPSYDDDYLLADFDDMPKQLEPPKEKPPPPPPMETESPEKPQLSGGTFKRIKKEIWRRRSDFLGIDPADNVDNVDVPPPPPNMADILKSERDLERQNRTWMEKERANSVYKSESPIDEEIIRREQEIIENLEREERTRRAQETEKDDQELVSAESKVATIARTEDDERIQRLQDERRRMEEERLHREEQRMRMEEERMFREREENLRMQEAHDRGHSVPNAIEPSFTHPVNKQPIPMSQLESGPPHVVLDEIRQAPEHSLEALKLEKERLKREQESLRKEREEYNRRLEIEQQKRLQQELLEQEKLKSVLPGRDAVICASKRPQGFQEEFHHTDPRAMARSSSVSELSSVHESAKEVGSHSPNHPSKKEALHTALGGAPKARIIQNEQWISQSEKTAKRRSEPPMSRESIYNQNHWLIQEAEMRRITEQNERQQQQQRASNYPSSDRRSSVPRYSTSPPHSPPRSAAAVPPPPAGGVRDPAALRHIASTAPRPYQRPTPPMPPPKPPHGLPVQKDPQAWNYRPVGPVVAPVSIHKSAPVPAPVDLRQYRSDVVPSMVPPPTTNVPTATPRKSSSPGEEQQDHLLSVSGKERCSHCGEPLGRGGAMIIESLQLCYHMHCFCCCVCQAQLGNGTCGTDVRVRNNKLHCQNCYSNDEAGLKFSQV